MATLDTAAGAKAPAHELFVAKDSTPPIESPHMNLLDDSGFTAPKGCGDDSKTGLFEKPRKLNEMSEAELVKAIDEYPNPDDLRAKNLSDYWQEKFLKPNSRPATTADYESWLKGYLANGGEVTREYGFKMPANNMFVATKDMVIPKMFKGNGVAVIAPEGINVTSHGGNNHVFSMDGFKASNKWIPKFGG